jgi:hypothetical protein
LECEAYAGPGNVKMWLWTYLLLCSLPRKVF